MKKLFILMMAATISLSVAAQKEKKEKPVKIKTNVEYTTASGLKYKITEQGKGVQAKPGDMVSVHYTGMFLDGKKFDSSKDRGQPITIKLGAGMVIKGWDEGIALLHVGDKAVFTIPPGLGYGDMQRGPIPANSTLVFEVELVNVKESVKPWVLEKTDTVTTASGLKYIVVSRNPDATAAKAETGRQVSVHYTGFLPDGRVFDSSVERGQPYPFPLGQGAVIKGWDEGIALMHVGDKLRLIIPPGLAYGDQGAGGGVIPGGATLLFDVELMGVQ